MTMDAPTRPVPEDEGSPPDPSTRPTSSPPPSLARWPENALRVVFVLAFIAICRDLLLPVALGGIFAVVLAPLHARIRRSLGAASPMAPAIVTIGSLLVLVTPVTWMTWEAIMAANELLGGGAIAHVGAFGERSVRSIGAWIGVDAGNDAAVHDMARSIFARASTIAGSLVADEVRALPTHVTELFLMTLSFYYYLRDGEALVAWLRRISPAGPADNDRLLEGMRGAIHGTILGIFVVGLVQGGVCLAALLALRVPGAFLWGGLAALCSVLPVVGTAPVTGGATIYLLVVDRPGAAAAMLATALFVAAIDNVVRPWVQSSHDRTHPLLELLAIFGGLAALGPAGLFIGPVLAAMARWAIESWRSGTPGPAIG